MEQEDVVNETSDSPHFGDEESLRLAKPVIPLEEIQINKKRNWLLMVLGLFIALGLGAGVALLLVHVKRPVTVQSSNSQPGNNIKADDPTVAAAGDEEEMMDLSEGEEINSQDQDVSKIRKRKRQPLVRNSDSEARVAPSTSAPDNPDNSTSNKPKLVEPKLVDQWEEKRSRRVKSSDRTRENVRHPDLFRIRDIFEGPRP